MSHNKAKGKMVGVGSRVTRQTRYTSQRSDLSHFSLFLIERNYSKMRISYRTSEWVRFSDVQEEEEKESI